jgi:hypothetical protein
MRTSPKLGWLHYRAELRQTIDENDLALLDANASKSIWESSQDMGVALAEVQHSYCNGESPSGLANMAYRSYFRGGNDLMAARLYCEDVKAALAAAIDWCERED